MGESEVGSEWVAGWRFRGVDRREDSFGRAEGCFHAEFGSGWRSGCGELTAFGLVDAGYVSDSRTFSFHVTQLRVYEFEYHVESTCHFVYVYYVVSF